MFVLKIEAMLASFLNAQNEAQLRGTIRDRGRVGSPGRASWSSPCDRPVVLTPLG
jgi:hypothetical protein